MRWMGGEGREDRGVAIENAGCYVLNYKDGTVSEE